MTPADLRARLEPLLGPYWQSRLAHALELNVRTVRRMLERDCVPAYVEAVAELLELAGELTIGGEESLPDRWHARRRNNSPDPANAA